jgi:hypothetical protein
MSALSLTRPKFIDLKLLDDFPRFAHYSMQSYATCHDSEISEQRQGEKTEKRQR